MTNKLLSIQYILIITDNVVGWPLGAIVAQGCHAVTACMAKYRNLPEYQDYIADENIGQMRKALLACTLAKWSDIKSRLEIEGVNFIEWYEQPENVLTSVALVPGSKRLLKPFISELPLLS